MVARMARPVDFGGILHRQHHGDGVEAAVGRLDMAVEDVVGCDGVVGKEAIGGFEHGAVATGFGQRGAGVLGQEVASSTRRVVRRRSPSSASANSGTAQLVSSARRLMPDSFVNGLLLGLLLEFKPPTYPKNL